MRDGAAGYHRGMLEVLLLLGFVALLLFVVGFPHGRGRRYRHGYRRRYGYRPRAWR
jgi:hypothetical protein